MTWKRSDLVGALVPILEGLDATVTVHPSPPSTISPPAYYVGYPVTVSYDAFAFGVDLVTIPLTAVRGLTESDEVDAMLRAAKDAVNADTTLGGAVPACRGMTQQAWRILGLGGSDYLAADLSLELRM